MDSKQATATRDSVVEDTTSGFTHWLDSPGARLLKLTSATPREFDRLARSVWIAGWRQAHAGLSSTYAEDVPRSLV